MDDDEFQDEILTEAQAETLALRAAMLCDMMRVDGCMDMESAERIIPHAREQYQRYGLAALQAYRKHRSLANPAVELQAFIKDIMAQADGYADYNSAIERNPDLQEVYDRYSFAAAFTIHRRNKKLSPTTVN